ncbi:hypothetical protein AKJ63_00165 [candidate division MSBL1 archaeon SCGC-AAA259D18]|uniref:Uncharacterized protein n=1 Tax=candidate division MSBL1 archaeon SCGC-AAA259D18 TaxID=1698262 RepID=A0A133UCS2_9EURY|nr:hypothetical protein AKJ63_00165 [candidate division MSBL1 archaeon SCGC-AAA259D18]
MQKKELLTRLDDQQANELETYITSRSMWSPVKNFVEEKGLRNDYTKGDFIKFLREVKEENSMNYAIFSFYSLKNFVSACWTSTRKSVMELSLMRTVRF